jgi:hypothetical protein
MTPGKMTARDRPQSRRESETVFPLGYRSSLEPAFAAGKLLPRRVVAQSDNPENSSFLGC